MKEITPDLDQLDMEVYGLLKSLAVLRGAYLAAPADLKYEMAAFQVRMKKRIEQRGLCFSEEVREKARQQGKPVPMAGAFLHQLEAK